MSILRDIIDGLRGDNQTTTDSDKQLASRVINSEKALEQEIENAKENLNQAKHDLTEVMAKEMQVAHEIETLNSEISSHEQAVIEALSQEDEHLAMTYVKAISALEKTKVERTQAREKYAASVSSLKKLLENLDRNLTEYERQLTMLETTANMQQAIDTIVENYQSKDSSVLSAKASLRHIRDKQETLVEDSPKQTQPNIVEDLSLSENAILERLKTQQQRSE